MRSSLRAGWIPWCAAVLLALLALSMVHVATPHAGAQRDCQACKALSSPGVAQIPGGLVRPVAETCAVTVPPPAGPRGPSAHSHRLLRAPPEFSIL